MDIILKTIERIAQLGFKHLRAKPTVGSSSLPATTSFDLEQSKYEMVMWREIDLNVFGREYGWYGGSFLVQASVLHSSFLLGLRVLESLTKLIRVDPS